MESFDFGAAGIKRCEEKFVEGPVNANFVKKMKCGFIGQHISFKPV